MNHPATEPGLPLRVPADLETGTPLRIDIKNVGNQLNSVLVGIDPDQRYWVIRTPTAVVTNKTRLIAGDEVTARFLHRGKAVGSGARIRGTIHDPDHLMFITIPEVLVEQNLRSTPRVTCFLPARLSANGDAPLIGAIKDISQGGCRFLIKVGHARPTPNYPDGSPIRVSFRATHMENELTYDGIVRNCRMGEERLSVGVKFEPFANEEQYRAIEHLSRLM